MTDIERIRGAYTRFLLPGRILMSGHSHQAWPDVARAAQLEAFDDSARFVDHKWEHAVFPLVQEVGRGVLARLGFPESDAIAFAESTHALLVRLLGAFEESRTRIVSTTGEFHSLDRQLRRYAEDGRHVVWVSASPRQGLAERLLDAIRREAAHGPVVAAFSAVLFEDAWILGELPSILAECERLGVTAVVDAYHSFNAVPLDWGVAGRSAYVVSGGYKYAGFGNGLCWLRIPPDCALRPRDTGWFADFASLSDPREVGGGVASRPVRYGAGAARFAGATFEASGFYRARAVLRHWDELGLGVGELRAISTRQTRRVIDGLRSRGVLGEGCPLSLASSDEDSRRGAFVSLRHPNAGALAQALLARSILTDSRGELLRLGPAPYVLDSEIDATLDAVAELVR
jgi:kynureninase